MAFLLKKIVVEFTAPLILRSSPALGEGLRLEGRTATIHCDDK